MSNGIICSICGEEVNGKDLIPGLQLGMINGAILWKRIEVTGHKSCVCNVDRIVVTENKLRLWTFIGSLKELLRKEGRWNAKIERALTDLEPFQTGGEMESEP
jgi:hypothetical protein